LQKVMGRPPIFVDAGGGFGVPYRPTETELDLDLAFSRLTLGLRSVPASAGVQLWVEPGRYLVADSTVLLTRVNDAKSGRPAFVGTDAGMQTLLRPALYDAYHAIYPAGPIRPGPRRRVTVTGPICENTDLLGRDRRLPPLEIGDLLAIATVGAYGYSMSSPYNHRPRPAELLVDGGQARLI
ncbi:diaminopimelate decarboxylase, partial [mine drainage metagenome]